MAEHSAKGRAGGAPTLPRCPPGQRVNEQGCAPRASQACHLARAGQPRRGRRQAARSRGLKTSSAVRSAIAPPSDTSPSTRRRSTATSRKARSQPAYPATVGGYVLGRLPQPGRSGANTSTCTTMRGSAELGSAGRSRGRRRAAGRRRVRRCLRDVALSDSHVRLGRNVRAVRCD
jgi:hypothetical protein